MERVIKNKFMPSIQEKLIKLLQVTVMREIEKLKTTLMSEDFKDEK